jgi:hypothetical protein
VRAILKSCKWQETQKSVCMAERGDSNSTDPLKTRNLFKTSRAQHARFARIAGSMYMAMYTALAILLHFGRVSELLNSNGQKSFKRKREKLSPV